MGIKQLPEVINLSALVRSMNHIKNEVGTIIGRKCLCPGNV